jgi:hypothetical protein
LKKKKLNAKAQSRKGAKCSPHRQCRSPLPFENRERRHLGSFLGRNGRNDRNAVFGAAVKDAIRDGSFTVSDSCLYFLPVFWRSSPSGTASVFPDAAETKRTSRARFASLRLRAFAFVFVGCGFAALCLCVSVAFFST